MRLPFVGLMLAALCAVSAPAEAQQKTHVRIPSGLTSPIRTLDTLETGFVSLSDFASLFAFIARPLADGTSLEVAFSSFRLRVLEGNRFASVSSLETGEVSVYQFTVPTVRLGAEFFIPLESFIRIYNAVETTMVVYDPVRRILSVENRKPKPVSAFDIYGLKIEEFENGYSISVLSQKPVTDYEARLDARGGMLYVTLVDVTADTEAIQLQPLRNPFRRVQTFMHGTSAQFTITLDTLFDRATAARDAQSNNILISLFRKRPLTKNELKERQRWKLDVIVIDAGHGGKDPGAIGVAGTYEKDITLSVARKLGREIQRLMPEVRIVYTRENDTFLELYRRTQIANEEGGKLFVSIHCNATPQKPSNAKGFEIYLLSPSKTESAVRIAELENSVVKLEENYAERYKNMTEESFIIHSLAQSAFVKYSERFAQVAAEHMAKGTSLKNNGVKQAGFYVLVGASMPNVLVEVGYISNRQEEKYLRSPEGQTDIVRSLARAVAEYRTHYEKGLMETGPAH